MNTEPKTAAVEKVEARLRRFCLGLDGAEEVVRWGHPNFRAGGKIFAVFERYKGEWAICFKAEPAHQQFLIDADPRFYASPYVGNQGWVSMKIEPRVDWRQTEGFIRGSYRLVTASPKRRPAARRPKRG